LSALEAKAKASDVYMAATARPNLQADAYTVARISRIEEF